MLDQDRPLNTPVCCRKRAPIFPILVLSVLLARPWLSAIGYAELSEEEQTAAAREGISILPSNTDPDIHEYNNAHVVCVERDIVIRHAAEKSADRGVLLLWLTGTKPPTYKPPPPGYKKKASPFLKLAAQEGYRVIDLQYPNDIPASFCRSDTDPEAFEKFRMVSIAGGESPHLTVTRTDCIENRLIKLLQFLQKIRAREHWEQFLTPEGGLRWERMAIAGQSQGGGLAALLGIHHELRRVICFGSPKDYSVALNGPAAWYAKPSATPKRRFFALNHWQDLQGCSPLEQIENLRILGVQEFGQPVEVDTAEPPYDHSHVLMTNIPGTQVPSEVAHTSALNPKYLEHFEPVMRYMLTEPVE